MATNAVRINPTSVAYWPIPPSLNSGILPRNDMGGWIPKPLFRNDNVWLGFPCPGVTLP